MLDEVFIWMVARIKDLYLAQQAEKAAKREAAKAETTKPDTPKPKITPHAKSASVCPLSPVAPTRPGRSASAPLAYGASQRGGVG